MFASVIPPVMCAAIVWAIAVSGVIWMPLVVEPDATVCTTAVKTSPDNIDMMLPVASSV